jgi:hypothetical protein
MIRVRDESHISVNFSTPSGVFEGDTIRVFLDDFMRCDDDVYLAEPLVYHFNRSLRVVDDALDD